MNEQMYMHIMHTKKKILKDIIDQQTRTSNQRFVTYIQHTHAYIYTIRHAHTSEQRLVTCIQHTYTRAYQPARTRHMHTAHVHTRIPASKDLSASDKSNLYISLCCVTCCMRCSSASLCSRTMDTSRSAASIFSAYSCLISRLRSWASFS